MLSAVAPKSCHSTTSETSAFLTCTLKTGPSTKSQPLPKTYLSALPGRALTPFANIEKKPRRSRYNGGAKVQGGPLRRGRAAVINAMAKVKPSLGIMLPTTLARPCSMPLRATEPRVPRVSSRSGDDQ